MASHAVYDPLMPHTVTVRNQGPRDAYGRETSPGSTIGTYKALVADKRRVYRNARGEELQITTTAYVNTDGTFLPPTVVVTLPAVFGGSTRVVAEVVNHVDKSGAVDSVEVLFQ